MATREPPPPPVIGKAGNLTVFITPSPSKSPPTNPTSPPTPSPKSKQTFNLSPSSNSNLSPSPTPKSKSTFNLSPSQKLSPIARESPASMSFKDEKTSMPSVVVVQVPPKQFEEECEEGKKVKSHYGSFGFFWDAVNRVQEAHSSLDEYLANWFGLNQSKYQWALNDYYETNPKEMETNKVSSKPKEIISKGQAV